MAPNFLRHILVEGLLRVHHPAVLLAGVEHREVHHEWVAFACDQILSDHLVGARVCNFAKVDVAREDVRLNLVICDLTGVQLHDEVLLEDLHRVVFLQVGEDLLGADRDLRVDHITAQLILPGLLFQRYMLLVELVACLILLGVLPVVKNLARLGVKQQRDFLRRVSDWVRVRDLGKNLGHDHGC